MKNENASLSLSQGNGSFIKNGRELQALLGSKKDHIDWAKDQIKSISLQKEIDYQIVNKKSFGLSRLIYWFTEIAANKIIDRSEVKSKPAIKNQSQGNGSFIKNGRELQKFLGSTKDHTNWAKDQINKLALKGDFDYEIVTSKSHTNQLMKTYWFTEMVSNQIAGHTEVRSENALMVKDNFAMKALTLDKIFLNPEAGIFILQGIAEQKNQIESQQLQIEAAKPKTEAFDSLMSAKGLFRIREAAKILSTGEKRLFAYLKEKKYMSDTNVAYQKHVESGLFKIKASSYNTLSGRRPYTQSFVTPKGLDYLDRKINPDKYTDYQIAA